MSKIRKIGISLIAISASLYTLNLYSNAYVFQETSEKLLREQGEKFISAIDKYCENSTQVESIVFKRDGFFAQSGTGRVYISGPGQGPLTLEYTAEVAGEKVYASLKDPQKSEEVVHRFTEAACK